MKKFTLLGVVLLALAGCGGDNEKAATPPGPPNEKLAQLANVCTPDGEKTWVRAHLDDAYLWYDEIVNVFPADYSSVASYFSGLLVKSKDRFSFIASQSEIDQYFQSGGEIGYGAKFVIADGHLRVAYAAPDTPAAQQQLTRGVEIVAINNVPLALMTVATRNAVLYPKTAGETNLFSVRDAGATEARTVQLSSAAMVRAPVPVSKVIATPDGKKIGYLLFTDHIASAEDPLIAAMTQFKQAGIDDLVLDLRYNGGGYLYIASELATMIAGAKVQNKIFEQYRFNSRHPEKTASPFSKLTFLPFSNQYAILPTLNLPRVFVLTGPGTCSASESVINGLSPFVDVITIGGRTCGKPYGFIQKNNCGSAYFAIQLTGVNHLGKGDYVNGFAPACETADDFDHALGDTEERLLASANIYRTTGSCPAVLQPRSLKAASAPLPATEVYRAPWQEIRLLQ